MSQAFVSECMHVYILPSLLCPRLAHCPVKEEQGRSSGAVTGYFYAPVSSSTILQPRCVSSLRHSTALIQCLLWLFLYPVEERDN